jgi:hypothetical protein
LLRWKLCMWFAETWPILALIFYLASTAQIVQ